MFIICQDSVSVLLDMAILIIEVKSSKNQMLRPTLHKSLESTKDMSNKLEKETIHMISVHIH